MDFTGYYLYTGHANRVNYRNIKWSSKEPLCTIVIVELLYGLSHQYQVWIAGEIDVYSSFPNYTRELTQIWSCVGHMYVLCIRVALRLIL